MTAATAASRPLRVAFLWNKAIQQDELLLSPEVVALGQQFPLPDTMGDQPIPVLTPKGHGYTLQPGAQLGGAVWIGGQRKSLRELAGPVDIGPEDFGVVTAGPVSVFFQHVKGAAPPPRDIGSIDLPLLFALLMALVIVGSAAFIAWVDLMRDPFDRDPFELDADLVAQFMVTPPPEDLFDQFQPESGTENDDPGLRTRDDNGGERHEDEEGRVGEENAQQEDTEIAGEVNQAIATKVRSMGLLGALDGGGEGNAIAAALDVPTISDILGGTGAAVTRAGRGSRGAGLLGVGMGGGGDGPGSLFGAGNVGTGQGAGMGGLGMGMGGIGARGRKAREVRISVMRGSPRVNGYLSAEQINRVVRANQAAVRYCYEVEVQRQPNLRGRVEIAWRINLQGAVTSSRVARSSLNNARVEGCITRQVRNWRFPRPDGGEVNVTYPFIFGVQGG